MVKFDLKEIFDTINNSNEIRKQEAMQIINIFDEFNRSRAS